MYPEKAIFLTGHKKINKCQSKLPKCNFFNVFCNVAKIITVVNKFF